MATDDVRTNSSYIHQGLTDTSTWDDVKRVFGLTNAKLAKLQENDPNTEEGRKLWVGSDITLHDAVQLWQRLGVPESVPETVEEVSNDNQSTDASATGDSGDPGLAGESSARRRGTGRSGD